MIILIALFMVSHTALIYVSQYNYVDEIRQYYKNEINLYLDEGKQAANVLEENSIIVEDSNLQPVFEKNAPLTLEGESKKKEEEGLVPLDP